LHTRLLRDFGPEQSGRKQAFEHLLDPDVCAVVHHDAAVVELCGPPVLQLVLMRPLAAAMRVNSTATSLNLGNNEVGEGGAQAIAEALRVNNTLTSLNLRYNSLGEGGAQAIAAALRENHTLTELNLNSLGEG